jgi:hypothetical protein
MLAERRIRLAAAMVLCAPALVAHAQPMRIDRQIRTSPGHEVRIAVYMSIRPDCTSGPLPGIRLLSTPAHGSVTVKRGSFKATNFKQCLATEVPVFVAFYRPAPNFVGTDQFELEASFADGRQQIENVRVSVTNKSGGAHGI